MALSRQREREGSSIEENSEMEETEEMEEIVEVLRRWPGLCCDKVCCVLWWEVDRNRLEAVELCQKSPGHASHLTIPTHTPSSHNIYNQKQPKREKNS